MVDASSIIRPKETPDPMYRRIPFFLGYRGVDLVEAESGILDTLCMMRSEGADDQALIEFYLSRPEVKEIYQDKMTRAARKRLEMYKLIESGNPKKRPVFKGYPDQVVCGEIYQPEIHGS